jgi:hypothetical protein
VKIQKSAGATLGVVLATPPLTDGVRTHSRLEIAASVLGFTEYRVANLFPVATQSIKDISAQGSDSDLWLHAREQLTMVCARSSSVLLGYGITEPTGPARGNRRHQIDWLSIELRKHGHTVAWHVGPEPRHPSRWHQYLSDRHGRTDGGRFEERLISSLVEVSTSELHGRTPPKGIVGRS